MISIKAITNCYGNTIICRSCVYNTILIVLCAVKDKRVKEHRYGIKHQFNHSGTENQTG